MDESCSLQIASDWLRTSLSLEVGIHLPAPETPLNAPWNMPSGRIGSWINCRWNRRIHAKECRHGSVSPIERSAHLREECRTLLPEAFSLSFDML